MRERALEYLRQALGDPRAQFRPGQWEAIETLVEHRERLLVVERTGWGKSIVYFIATRLLRDQGAGCALLISPLEPTLFTPVPALEPAAASAVPKNSHSPYDTDGTASAHSATHPRDAFEVVLADLLLALAEPGTEKNLEQALGIVPAQAKAWLRRACDEGHVRKLSRPVRYVAVQNVHPLFDGSERGLEEVQKRPAILTM